MRARRPFQVLVLGTSSHAGKSLLAAGLCRILADRGFRVAPFKAQNMALNSAVADDGAEIGRAQQLQAQAARVPSQARMNPVLLKPVSGKGSQLVLLGKAQGVFSTREYFRRWPAAARAAKRAWSELAAEHEALVMEGAGSPAEVNLARRDLANLETARFSGAPFILVADIERGGSFAAAVGTLELLPPWLRRRCLGLVFNKFRGDASLLKPGLAWLKRRGIRTLGVLPWLDGLELEEEDSLGLEGRLNSRPRRGDLLVDALRLPRLANYNDMLPLQRLPGVCLRWVRPGQRRSRPDLVILPGSKDSLADLEALKRSGEAEQLRAWKREGTWLLGICGGFQMLGRRLADPGGYDGGKPGGAVDGLGWLDAETRMSSGKLLRRRRLEVSTCLGRLELEGYEIHHGRTRLGPAARLEAEAEGSPVLVRSRDGKVWGSYLHGLLDGPGFRDAFFGALARSAGKRWKPSGQSLALRREASLRRWAAHVERHLDLSCLPGAPASSPRP